MCEEKGSPPRLTYRPFLTCLDLPWIASHAHGACHPAWCLTPARRWSTTPPAADGALSRGSRQRGLGRGLQRVASDFLHSQDWKPHVGEVHVWFYVVAMPSDSGDQVRSHSSDSREGGYISVFSGWAWDEVDILYVSKGLAEKD